MLKIYVLEVSYICSKFREPSTAPAILIRVIVCVATIIEIYMLYLVTNCMHV
jgi:hypothetical protein